jgi:hypothetical protein
LFIGIDIRTHKTPQADGNLNNDITPDGEREGLLESYGLAVSGTKGDLCFNTEWSHEELDVWIRSVLPKPFEYLDDVRDSDECAWRLLKTSRNKLRKGHAKPRGYAVKDAKGNGGKSWSESKIYLGMDVLCNVECSGLTFNT